MNDITYKATVNGAEVFYEYHRHPSAQETFVLLHGFLSSTFSFRHLTPLLKEQYNVISVDLPPFGQSGKNKEFIYSYENLAKTVILLMEKLEIDNIQLIGHSMGGQIALNVMKQKPELVEKGILLCSSGYLKRMNWPITMLSYIPFFHLYVKMHLAKSGIRQNLENVVHDSKMINDEMMFGYLKPFLDDDIFRALTRMIRHREGDLIQQDLHKIQTPCLLIWGRHDRVVPLHIGKRLNKDLPNSKLLVLENTGHLVPEERPQDVYDHIRSFTEQQFEEEKVKTSTQKPISNTLPVT
ncbi:alpha/beta fold hydrolase [Bacillus sp. SG-1]|uniref:alpha/beta fold hydrolase n=1 Tax=Bacillus sp. SG-1 TaxID=161544 RepID=UPI0001544C95|nr:alpha/beta hydrolase [Bacillus sp. SG-1]EDL62712.1 YugF [Bacillus sp. SG-1]